MTHKPSNSAPLHILITGQVDHGKSTLIGRLIYECGQMPEKSVKKLEKIASNQGLGAIEWAFALDSLELERQQGITLDASRIWLKRPARELVLIDVPGHHELLSNMLTGASDADAALLLIDAAEGMTEQTRLHTRLLRMLGLSNILIVITKMDKSDYSQQRFDALSADASKLFDYMDNPPPCIPISAHSGEHMATASTKMPWANIPTLLQHMDAIQPEQATHSNAAMRFCVQDVIKHGEDRIILGALLSGSLSVGDDLLACPKGSQAQLASFKHWPPSELQKTSAISGESLGLMLSQPIFAQRGDILCHPDKTPMFVYQSPADIIWLAQEPAAHEDTYQLRLATQSKTVTLHMEGSAALTRHQLMRITIKSRSLIVTDHSNACPALARFVLENQAGQIVAAGVLLPESTHDQSASKLARKSDHISPFAQPITPERYEARHGHPGKIFWLSGLSGSGKSTLAIRMQAELFERGMHVVVLDGDNMRGGLCRDLGFSEVDRRENIRRTAEVARLMAQHGSIVITAFITPTAEDRALASSIAGSYLHHIYVNADLALCEARDTKGLYKKARAGEIAHFTGISAPFDTPANADCTINTAAPLEQCSKELMAFIEHALSK